MDSDEEDRPVHAPESANIGLAPSPPPVATRRSPARQPKSILKRPSSSVDNLTPSPPEPASASLRFESSDDDLSSLESDHSDEMEDWRGSSSRGRPPASGEQPVQEPEPEPEPELEPELVLEHPNTEGGAHEIGGVVQDGTKYLVDYDEGIAFEYVDSDDDDDKIPQAVGTWNPKWQRIDLYEVEAATTKIQASVRGKLARRQRADEATAATRIQAVYRGQSTRKERTRTARGAATHASADATDEVEAATTKIQASVRGKLARRQRADEATAATRIQAVYRGQSTRKVRRARSVEAAASEDASSQLAEITRKYEAEKAQRQLLEQKLRLVMREDATEARAAAIRIQSTFRGRMVRNRGASLTQDQAPVAGTMGKMGHVLKRARSTERKSRKVKSTAPKNAARSRETALVLGGAAAAAAAAAGASRSAVAVAAGSAAANTIIALGGSAVAAAEAAVSAATNARGSPADVAHIAGLAAGNAAIAARVSPSAAASTASAACHAQQSSAAFPAVVAGAIAGKAATLRGAKPKQAGNISGLAARSCGGSQTEVAECTWLATVAAAQWQAAGNSGLTDRTAAQHQHQHIQQQLNGQGGGLETKLRALEAQLAASGGRGTATGDGRRLAKQIKILQRRLEQHSRPTTPRLIGPSAASGSAIRSPTAIVPSKEVAAIFAAALVFAPIPSGSAAIDALSVPRSRPPPSSSKTRARPIRPGRRLVFKPSSGPVRGTSDNQQLNRPRSAPAINTRGGRDRTPTRFLSDTSTMIPLSPHPPQTPKSHPSASAPGTTYDALQARGPAGVGGLIVRAPAPAALAAAHLGMARQDNVHISTRVGQAKSTEHRPRRSKLGKRGTGGSASALLRSNAWSRG